MLYADDACIVSRTPRGLGRMMAVFVEVFGTFGLTISETKTETMCIPIPRAPATKIVLNATGQQYRQTTSFTYLGSTVTETPNLSDKIDRRIRAGWVGFKRYKRELYDRPKASLLPLKARMVRSEVVEALLYGYAAWTPLKGHYAKLRTTHHRMLLQILGAWCKSPNKRILSYEDALQRTKCESIEATMRTRRLLWVGALLRIGDQRLPKRVMSGELENAGKRGPGGEEKEWTDCVADDLRLFGVTGDWSTAALDPEAWYNTVHEGGCRFMAAWMKEEENASNQRQKKREAEEADKVEVAPGVTVASLRRFRVALIGPTQGLPKRRRLCVPLMKIETLRVRNVVDATRLGAWLRSEEGIGWLAASTMPNSLYRVPFFYLFLACVCCFCSFLFVVFVFVVVVLFFCSRWSFADVPLIFFCPSRPRTGLATTYMVEARSVNLKKTTNKNNNTFQRT